jgi:peptidoglycan/LPS O-acetylase OafA/YrhL
MDFLGHTWSLSIEEQFYLAWPLLLYLGLRSGLDRRRLLLLISLLALGSGCWRIWLCAGGASIERLYNGLDTRLDGLMIGAAFGLAMASGMLEALRPYCRGLLAWACMVAIAGLSWILLRIPADDPRMYQYGLVAVALAAVVLILHVCWNADGLLDRILSWAPLVWLGSISYAIYLWHYPIFRWFSHAGYSGLFNLCVGSALSILLAAVSWRLLERPALAMKRRFAGARRPESAAAAA